MLLKGPEWVTKGTIGSEMVQKGPEGSTESARVLRVSDGLEGSQKVCKSS